MQIEYEKIQNRKPVAPALIRRLLLSWLIAAAVEFLLLPDGAATMNGLQALSAMSFPRLLIVTGAVLALLEGKVFIDGNADDLTETALSRLYGMDVALRSVNFEGKTITVCLPGGGA